MSDIFRWVKIMTLIVIIYEEYEIEFFPPKWTKMLGYSRNLIITADVAERVINTCFGILTCYGITMLTTTLSTPRVIH